MAAAASRGLQLAAARRTVLGSGRFGLGRAVQRRPVTTEHVAQQNDILARQRLNRPVVPTLTIYRPQITWTASALNRITGSVLSGGLYLFGFCYLVSPLIGWHIDTAGMAAAFGSLPGVVKGALKGVVALPFTFHSFNGLRHLAWDMGWGFAKGTVIRSGWVVIGVSVVSALGLAAV